MRTLKILSLCALALAGARLGIAPAAADPALSNYGLYLGAYGIYGDGFVDGTASPALLSSSRVEQAPSGFGGGLTVGYDHLIHDTWLFGIAGDYAWQGGEDSNSDASRTWTMDNHASIRGKFGIAMDPRVAVYLTAGGAMVDARFEGVADTASERLQGWVIGGGIDIHLTRRWSMNIEYLHEDFGEWSFDADGDTYNVGLQSEVLKVGVRVPLGNWFSRHEVPLK